jgi:hypothetical protein
VGLASQNLKRDNLAESSSVNAICFCSGSFVSSLSPSPERIAEAFREPLLENKHSVSAGIHHAAWEATLVMVVVARHPSLSRRLTASKSPTSGSWWGETTSELKTKVTWQIRSFSRAICFNSGSFYLFLEPLPRKDRRSF